MEEKLHKITKSLFKVGLVGSIVTTAIGGAAYITANALGAPDVAMAAKEISALGAVTTLTAAAGYNI